MTGHRYGPPSERNLASWSSLAFVLNTGHPTSDPAGNRVVAVTGYLDSEGIKLSVVTRNSQVRDGCAEVVKQHISPSENAEDLLKWKDGREEFTFTQHLEDVNAIMNYCINADKADWQDLSHNVFLFIIRRAYPKIYARITNGRNIWGEHPIHIIAQWYNSDPPRSLELKKVTIEAPTALFRLNGVQPCSDDPKSYMVSSHNAKNWCNVLVKCLEILEDVFKAERDKKQRQPVPMPPPSSKYADIAFVTMKTLHVMLKSGVVGHLITPVLAGDLQEKYDAKMSPRAREASTTTAGISASAGGGDESDEAEDVEDGRQVEHESSKQHVLRYLQTIVIPYTSAHDVAALGRLGEVSVEMELITMIPNRPDVTTMVVEELQGKILEALLEAMDFEEHERGEMKTAIEKVSKERLPSTKLESIKDGATVHAEAALMGVAYGIANNNDKFKDKDGNLWAIGAVLPAASPVRIGVSKKCCYCCNMLSSSLKEWRGLQTDPNKFPVFELPGTHAGIFPWMPPPGIPAKVLQDMRQRLLEILFEIVRGGLAKSTQTSPAMSATDMPALNSFTVPPSDFDQYFL
ncbi:hypothetical protein C8Q74DRAFT_1368005 [Fomes fomentarius]|nr:hypothetical protein C8Q74DRAFT_1368005 [Fomes fomentarius]